jgi:5-methylcytosine-specific restriction endonuclease McrA
VLVLNEQPLCQIAKICVERLGHVALSTCVDHIVPLAAGGTDAFENLQGACSDCNEWKARTSDQQLAAEHKSKASKP